MKAVLFGGFDLLDAAGQPVKWRTLKTKEIMAYFLAKEGQPVSKWELMADLWPELNEEQSRTYLHTTLYNLKKALKDAGGSGQIHYVSGQYHAGLGDIENPLRLYRDFERSRPPLTEATIGDYQALASLYQGELFARLDYSWCSPYRELCFGLFRQTCIRLSRYFLDKGNPEAAAKAAGQLLAQSETDEDAHEMMLQVHFQKNDRTALRHQYELLEKALMSELGLPPKPAVERLYAGMMAQIGSDGAKN
ncbi:Bacterial transcriptional activator domain protein [compost metagenome]